MEGKARRFTIPICLVVSIMIALMTISTAIIAFTPTYLEGQHAALNTLDKLRASLVSDTQGKIAQFFNVPIKHIRTLELAYNQSVFQPWLLTPNQSARFLGELIQSSAGRVLSDIGIWMPTQGIATTVGNDPANGKMFLSMLVSNAGPLVSYPLDNVTFAVNYSSLTASFPFSGAVLAFAPFFVEATGSSRPTWKKWAAAPSAAYDEMQMTVTFRFVDGAGHKGAIGANIVPSSTSQMLSQLNIGSSARAVLVHTATGIILGNSWLQPTQILNTTNVTSFGSAVMQYQSLIAPDAIRMQFIKLNNLTDPLVARALAVYSPQFLLSVPTPFQAVIGKPGVDDAFVDVFSVTDDFGLDVRVILLQPLSDHVGDMYRVRNIVIAAVTSAVAVLILVGGWFAIVVTRPLGRLGERMQLTAQLMDDGDDEELSALTEVCLIQASYNTMRAELNRAKSYLPQSVLQQDDSETETPSSRSQTPSRNNSVEHRSTTSSLRRGSANANAISGVVGAGIGGGAVGIAVHPYCKHLNTVTVLRRKLVSVAVFNAVGWHSKISSMLPTECLKYQEQYVSIIAKAISDERGVVDFFQGDHVVATYNAVNALPSSARRSTASALAAVVELRKVASMPPVCVGIGIGQAVCGNSGSEKMHRFNVMGPVYSEAFLLEAVARKHLSVSPIILSGLGFTEVDMEFVLQLIDILPMPAGNGATERRSIAAVHSRKATMNEEWMYELKDSENENPFRYTNSAFTQLLMAGSAAAASAEGSVSPAAAGLREDLRVKLAQHQSAYPSGAAAATGTSLLNSNGTSNSSCINVAGGGGIVEFAGARLLANILASAKTDEELANYVSTADRK